MNINDPSIDMPTDAAAAVSGLTAALTKPYDVVGIVVDILRCTVEVAGASAGGLILRRLGQDRLQLLAATSHRAEELELYQAQHEQGPCFDAMETGEQVTAATAAQINTRWPRVAAAFQRANMAAVHAVPLRWQSDVIGALNLFFATDQPTPTRADLRVFADLATLAIVHNTPVPTTEVLARTRTALDERTVIEQAKGVLAQQHHLDMAAAYQLLLDTARKRDEGLSLTAAAIIQSAARQP